jgi:hypothetical protein
VGRRPAGAKTAQAGGRFRNFQRGADHRAPGQRELPAPFAAATPATPAAPTASAAVSATTAAAVSATTAAAISTATAAAISTATPAAVAPAATATATATGALARLADADRAALDVAAIQDFHRLRRVGVAGHLDEREPTRASGVAVEDHLDVLDSAALGEDLTQIGFSHVVRQISDV